MFLRFALCIGVAAAAISFAEPQPSQAQTSTPPAAPDRPAKRRTGRSGVAAAARRSVRRGYDAYRQADRLREGHRQLGQRVRDHHQLTQDAQSLYRQGRSQSRRPADDHLHRRPTTPAFSFRPPFRSPRRRRRRRAATSRVGTSPEGHALKFVHRGSYDGLDNTYEAITNYLDERRLEAKDMFIEQYVTDPLSTNEDHLVVNVVCHGCKIATSITSRHGLPPLNDNSPTPRPGRSVRNRSAGIRGSLQRLGERDERRIDRFVGELERAVVVRERELGAAIDERLHRLGRIHVLVAHEPARLVSPDRQNREPERSMALARLAEMPAVAIAGIGDEIDPPGRRFDHERRPQRHVAVGQAARRPMPRRQRASPRRRAPSSTRSCQS